MLLAQGQIYAKNMAFYVRIGCLRFARYCGKMYSRHLFPYGGLATLPKLSYRTYRTIREENLLSLDISHTSHVFLQADNDN